MDEGSPDLKERGTIVGRPIPRRERLNSTQGFKITRAGAVNGGV